MQLPSRRRVLRLAAVYPFLFPKILSGQTFRELSVEFLETELKKFKGLSDGCRNAVHALRADNSEIIVLGDLLERSTFVEDYLVGERFSVRIYNGLSCKTDRDIARPILKQQTLYYSIMMGGEIDKIGMLLPGSKVLSTVQSGDKMRDEIRSLKETFESFAASLG